MKLTKSPLFIDEIEKLFPTASAHFKLKEALAPTFSQQAINLPASVYERAEQTIKSLFSYSHSERYLNSRLSEVDQKDQEILNGRPNNHSALMAYDFHYLPEKNQLSLIEVNTNASGYLIAALAHHKADKSFFDTSVVISLFDSFKSECLLGTKSELGAVATIDEDLPQQKMLVEFYMYKDFFKYFGVQNEIFDYKDVPLQSNYNFLYNRYCDFNLSENRSRHLRKAYLDKEITFSPNPAEYLLLADKVCLIHFYKEALSDTLIPIVPVAEQDAETLWSERKKYFFKPSRLFGAKAVYKGASIAQKAFQTVLSGNYLAQEIRPPGIVDDWKFDLRFYVYKDEIQLSTARLYKGQVTNFNSPGGGFTRVNFS